MTLIPFVVGRYLKRVAHERSGHSRRHRPKSRPWEDHMLLPNSDTSEVHSGHRQHLFMKQSSLPHDVEPDTRKKMETSTFPRQMSEDAHLLLFYFLLCFVCCCGLVGYKWNINLSCGPCLLSLYRVCRDVQL